VRIGVPLARESSAAEPAALGAAMLVPAMSP
jgi:hypothetical protein